MLNSIAQSSARAGNLRAVSAFCIVLAFGLALQILLPSKFYDNLMFDYNSVSASHAILFKERNEGTPNRGNLNINSHPGIPYYLAMGVARSLAYEENGNTPLERTVNFFRNIDEFWRIQGIMAAVIAAVGAGLLTLYCREAPLLFSLALFALPLAYINSYCSAYCYTTLNETFALPVVSLFLLIAQRIFVRNEYLSPLFIAFGAVAGAAYSIKLPYISLFLGGLAVAPLLVGINPKNLRALLTYSLLYVSGFILFWTIVCLGFGVQTIRNILIYHYNTLTHDNISSGESGIIFIQKFINNVGLMTEFFGHIYLALFLCMALFLCLIYKRKLYLLRWRQCVLIIILLTLHSMAVLKHWKWHYALVMIIFFCLFLYETATPFWDSASFFFKRTKLRTGTIITLLLCIAVVLHIKIPLETFKQRLESLPTMRESRAEFINKINMLPLKEREGIYFQWGTHILPIFSLSYPLHLTYLEDPRVFYNVIRTFYPELKIQTSVTYHMDKKDIAIRYLVTPKARVDIAKNGSLIVPWDSPHPRMALESGDKKILEWRNLVVIEKAVPISDAQ